MTDINKLKGLIDIQKDSLINDYMIGLYNGMEFVRSIIEHDDPKYEECKSRTCENCKHYEYEYCQNEIVNDIFYGCRISKDFGCNKFERKQ